MSDLTPTELREYAACNLESLGPNILRRLLTESASAIEALTTEVEVANKRWGNAEREWDRARSEVERLTAELARLREAAR